MKMKVRITYIITFLCINIAAFSLNYGTDIEVNQNVFEVVKQDTSSYDDRNSINKVWSSDGFTFKVELNLVDENSQVRLEVYNMLAKPVKLIDDGKPQREYIFDTSEFPNGPYFCVLQGNGYRDTYKFTINR